MINSNFVFLTPLLVIAALVACGPVIPSNRPLQNEPILSQTATEPVFILTKFAGITAEAETQTAISPKNDATLTAILATKFVGATQAAGTITAQPTETPIPAIPTNAAFCTPADLKTNYAASGSTGSALLSVVMTNINAPCYLQAWPQATLVDVQGNALDVDYSYLDLNSSESASASIEKIGLGHGWTARFDLIWSDSRTWCGAPVIGNLVIRLKLMNESGILEVPTDFQPGTVCDPPSSRTSVIVSKIYLEPPPISVPEEIKMFDENHGWMIGGEDFATRRLFYTDDGGLTWNDITPSSIADIEAGFFLDAQTAWIPSAAAGTNIPTIVHTTDAGKSWQQYQDLPFKQASLDFANPLIGWATADVGVAAGNLYFTLYQTLDGGTHWRQLILGQSFLAIEPSLPRGTIHIVDGQDFKFLNPSTIWFGGNQIVSMSNVVFQVSHDSGKTWTKITIDVPESNRIGDGILTYGTPDFITQNDGYVVASYALPNSAGGSDVIMTHDGGNTWTASHNLIAGETNWSLHIDFISPTEAFFHCGDSLCLTRDSMQTWTAIPSNFSFSPVNEQQTLQALDFVDAQVGWAIVNENGANQLIKTTDGGRTWIVPPLSSAAKR
jgi:photosystem II stability/assembly factor-like uncharacterized protein